LPMLFLIELEWALTILELVESRLFPPWIVRRASYEQASLVPVKFPKLVIPHFSTCPVLNGQQDHRGVETHSQESEETQYVQAHSSHTPTRSTGPLEDLAEFAVPRPTWPGIVIP